MDKQIQIIVTDVEVQEAVRIDLLSFRDFSDEEIVKLIRSMLERVAQRKKDMGYRTYEEFLMGKY